MEKLDLKEQFKELYSGRKGKVELVEVPLLNYLMIDGQGDPTDGKAFEDSLEALYGMANTLKFMIKKSPDDTDYGVAPLEGLWWADDPAAFKEKLRDEWKWTLMVLQPDFISSDRVEEARAQLEKKKHPAALPRLRFESFDEGTSVQTMHVGPYDNEESTISLMHRYIALNNYHPNGKHHEIYLNDPRRTSPEKLRTILRQPVRKA